MVFYLDEPVYDRWILEAAIATPYSVEENIRRGHEAMRHVISSHKTEPRAMYREEIGWIAFSWGTPGNEPPHFKNKEEAIRWWASLPGQTNAQKGSKVYAGGRGVSHIIAKRDFEAKWLPYFSGQSGVEVAMKCVEVIAKGITTAVRQKREITLGKMRVSLIADSRWVESTALRAGGKKREDFWLLSGFEIVDKDENYGIFESAGVNGSRVRQSIPTHTMPTVTRHDVGATNSTESAVEWGSGNDLAHTPTHIRPTLARPYMGAANSGTILMDAFSDVNMGWPY